MNVIPFEQWDYNSIKQLEVLPRPRGNQGGKRNNPDYMDTLCAFDIETTTLEDDQAVMYIWQFCIYKLDTVIIGRTWNDFLWLLDLLETAPASWCIYVHNLSFEFQYLRGIYDFMPEEVFALDNRKVLKCTMREMKFEFRCSYIQTNMSLSSFTKKYHVQHQKLDGDDFDYSKKRFSWSDMTDEELAYCAHDVMGLCEALDAEMNTEKDNLYSIPLTSTGYVRRDAKQAMRFCGHSMVPAMLPDLEQYHLLREAFRGGNTHANRFYVGEIIENVKSADRASSYPDVQCNCKYPMSHFVKEKDCSPERVLELINVRKRAVITRVAFYNIRLRIVLFPVPYISTDKCRNELGGKHDNGRVLRADYLETTITDIDLQIILSEYDFDNVVFFDTQSARYGYLPRPLVECTIEYFRRKTELKGSKDSEEQLQYMKSKNKLNSIYGMMATDICKDSILFLDDEFKPEGRPEQEILDDSNKRAFLAYQWGVWVTAHARYKLELGIRLATFGNMRDDNEDVSGDCAFLYCDTDSVKYIGDVDWSEFNQKAMRDSKRSGLYATDRNGITHYGGVFEPDDEYEQFCTLGAKKYVGADSNGLNCHATIAGVNKKKGGVELDANGGISAFKPGFVFRKAGGKELIYNDCPVLPPRMIDGHEQKITSNVVIKDHAYTLGLSSEYADLLQSDMLIL